MKQILIVEDEFPIALDIESRVKKLGYGVVGIANTYEMATLEMSKSKPDLVFLDINLNDKKSGLDIARWINENLKAPFIFITAYSDKFTFQQALEFNPSGFLNKPVTDNELMHQVEIAFRNEQSRQEEMEQWRKEFEQKYATFEAETQAHETPPAGWEELSKREKEVLCLLKEGYSDKDLAEKLFVSVTTIRTHLRRAYDKLLIGSRLEAVALLNKFNLS